MYILSAFMYVYHMYVRYSQRSEKGVAYPGTRVIDGYELPVGARTQTQVLYKKKCL